MTSSRILAFYRGGLDDRGRTLDEILAWDLPQLEWTHDYIQWMFPLPERSGANPAAPVLSPQDIAAFRNTPALQAAMLRSLDVMLRFYGLERRLTDPPMVARRADFATRAGEWLTPGNHNFLRLTRIIRSLRAAGLAAHAGALFSALADIYRERGPVVGTHTFAHWQRALEDPSLA
jgi:Opioid growth factor receptor (OGFr) conserved region